MILDLDPIRARTDAATRGPWKPEHGMFGSLLTAGRTHLGPLTIASVPNRRDAEFIAASREDVSAMIAELERTREVLGRTAAALESLALFIEQDRGMGRGLDALIAEGDPDALLAVEARTVAGIKP